ncbi:MAG: hypothetical protein A2144_12380 [Chloroflexi bacterium RBG_16_50_9]|nr:MAG: hypothetical protein A2144_12380 [Chloroflexi bacterium RBG_16_50_9]
MDLSLTTVGVIGILLFLLLMFLQMPIGVAILLAGFVGLWLTRGMPAALSATAIIIPRAASTYLLSVIPLFIWMGMLASHSGVSMRAYSAMHKWLGHFRGGLAIATVGAGAAFGAVCGNNVACAATMQAVALPEMRKYGYSDGLSLGSIAAAGNLGIMIPPSGAFVVYGFLTEESIGALFMAGVLPGLLITFLFWLQIYMTCRLNPRLATQGPATSWKERLIATKDLAGILVTFIIVIGGIYLGIFTPTEGASIGVAAVIVIGLINRQLTWRGFLNSLVETGEVTAMVLLLIFGAMVFSSFTTTTEIAFRLADLIATLAVNRYAILAAILVLYILAGLFMDIFAVLIISLPIVYPIVVNLGFDPIQFGVLSVLCIMIGCITPPFGILVFAIYGMAKKEVPMYTIFRGCLPFLGTMIVSLVILVAFPQISLFLPNIALPYR